MKILVKISRFLIIPIFLIKTKQEIFTKSDEEPNFTGLHTYLYYHWKRRFKIEDSPVETDSMAPQFRQIVKPAQVSGLSMTLPNGIRIGLDGMSMEDLSCLLVNMGRHA